MQIVRTVLVFFEIIFMAFEKGVLNYRKSINKLHKTKRKRSDSFFLALIAFVKYDIYANGWCTGRNDKKHSQECTKCGAQNYLFGIDLEPTKTYKLASA